MSEQRFAWRDIEPEQVDPVFADAHVFVEEGADLHGKLAEAKTELESDPQQLNLAADGIAESEQQLDISLRDFGQSEQTQRVYGAIGHFLVVNSANMSRTEERVNTLNQQSTAKMEEIEAKTIEIREMREQQMRLRHTAELERMRHLSPNAVEDLKRLQASRTPNFNPQLSPAIQALEDEQLHILEEIEAEQQRQRTFTERQARLDALIEQGGEAWPLPSAHYRRFRPGGDPEGKDEPTKTDDSVQIDLDELPVEPQLSERGSRMLAAMRERHIDAPDASQFIALYLMETAGKAVSVRDLGNFLYTDDMQAEISETNLRARITTLLGPATNIVGRLLDEEGYVLQYGWRRTLDKKGGKIKIAKTQRIYRALTKADADALKPGEYKTENESGTYRDEFVIEKRSETTDSATEAEVAEANKTEQEWIKTFRQQIGTAINQLESLGLLNNPGQLPLRYVRTAYGNSGRVTDTGLDKFIRADLLPQLHNMNVEARSLVDVSPVDLVIIETFNAQKGPLRKGNRNRARAIELIEESLAAYFSKKQQQ